LLADDVLQVRVDLIAIAVLIGVEAKARTTTEIALQRSAPAIDEIDKSGRSAKIDPG